MSSNPIALALADLHIHDWKQFSKDHNRLEYCFDILLHMVNKAIKYKVPILFTGDLFHNPKQLDNIVITKTLMKLKCYLDDKGVDFVAISGNHDMSEKNTDEYASCSYLMALDCVLKNFHLIDNDIFFNEKLIVVGVPYLSGNKGFKKLLKNTSEKVKNSSKFKILLIHTDIPGMRYSNGLMIDDVENLPDKIKGFDLILSGHIHKKQKVNNIYMLGAPYQQNRSEGKLDMGYWLIYKNKKPKFRKLKYPEYREIEEGEELPDDYNFYTKIPKQKEKEQEDYSIKFNNRMSGTSIAKAYCKTKGIKNKIKKKALINILKND